MGIATWFAATLRQYPEIAIFLTLAIGYYFGKFTFRGIGLGSVTATLLAGVLIGQLGITISQPLKAFVFLMFLFAVGYGVGPQFIRGIAKDGVPQALFAVVLCVLCLGSLIVIVKLVGYDLGYAAGLYSGSQTISAAMGLSTDAINRLGLPADQAKKMLDSMPIAYAVSYMFGTMGSAIIIALVGPALLGINLREACKDYEEKFGGGGKKELGGAGSAWRRWELRAFKVPATSRVIGLRAIEAEALVPNQRLFIQRLRRNGIVEEANADTVLQEGDVIAVAGAREVLLSVIYERAKLMAVAGDRPMPVSTEPVLEMDDPELLNVPVEGIDVYVTSKEVDGKTLAEIAVLPSARGVFLRKITRGAVATSIPIMASTKIFRGDIVTGRPYPGHSRRYEIAGRTGPSN
jgi:putative transport protein